MPRGKKWMFVAQLPSQLFYLTFYAGYMPLLLFLPLYLKYNGLSTTQVGLLSGLKPLVQAIGAPIFVKLIENFRVKKIVFVVSCIVMVGKFSVIFLVLRPGHQVCRTINSLGEVNDTFIQHKLSKRSDVTDEWMQTAWNNDASDISFARQDTTQGLKLQKHKNAMDRNDIGPLVQPTKKEDFSPSSINKTHVIKMIQVKIRIDRDNEVRFVFTVILVLTLATDYFDAVVFTLVDSAYRPKTAFRAVGVWGDMAWAFMTLIIGIIMDQNVHEICGKMIGSFHYIFYFFVAFVTIAMLIGVCLDLTTNPFDSSVAKKVQSSLWNFQYNIFILAYALMGFFNGFLFSFVYWYIDTLGGDAMIMGLSTACECLVSISLFVACAKILNYIDHMSAVCVGFVGYIGLFISYYSISNPWYVIPVKIIQALVSGLMMFTCNSFFQEAAPAGSSYQMQGTLHGIYLATGTAIGAMFSGSAIYNYRFPRTFLLFTIITCIISFLFVSIQLFLVFTEGISLRNSNESSKASSASGSSQFGDDEEETGDHPWEGSW